MAIISTVNWLSEQRAGIDDMRRIESASRSDWDTSVTAVLTNTSQGYIVRGFSIVVGGSIGSPANNLQMVVDPGSVLNINASVSGTIYQTPTGTPNQVLNAATNTNVIGSFAANSTNYVGIDYYRFADASTDVTKYIWNSAANDELPTIAPAAQTMTFQIYITTSVWALNVLPVAIVVTDANGNVISITDSRWMLCSLETGGLNPNPNYVYPWSEGRTQPPVTTTSDSEDPFNGGDKQLTCLKDWMNAVMTTFLEIKGTAYWFSGSGGSGPQPSIVSLFQDLGNTVITGSGEISNGILPNSDPILVTTGNISQSSNQLTSLASVAGVVDGDFIFGTGIQQGSTVVSISGSTITMSKEATLNGTGIGVRFYSPSVITAPGQINWNDPIEIRVIGSSLTYALTANPSSTDITLTDDEAAYITLVRNQAIIPNLIFGPPNATNVVSSVGNVVWTSGLLPGDYIKIASDNYSGYYQIAPVGDGTYPSGGIINGYTVGLATGTVINPSDYTGVGGAQAQYAFGSYSAAPTPSTNRNIYIAARNAVPVNGNVFWLFLREDNGGAPRVYIRFLSQELDNGESVEVSGTTSQELLDYIGSPSAAASSPQYVSALNPGSVPQITDITIGGGGTITAGQYFTIYSSGNYRFYTVWFKVNGSGSLPLVANSNASIEVDILSSDSATAVATKLANAFNTSFFLDFSAVAGVGTVAVTNTSAGICNNASNGDVGAPFAISIAQNGTGAGNFAIHDGDNLTLAIKELDDALGNLAMSLDEPTYDEVVEIVASGGTYPPSLNSPVSVNGPVANTGTITLPNNSRLGNVPAFYTVGKGTLQVFLNGQFLDVESGAYTEVGTAGTPSNEIEIISFPGGGLVVGDEVEFRIGAGGGGSSGGGTQGPPGVPGPTGPAGADAAGGPVAISTKTSSYSILSSDCFLMANCTSGPITFTLPTASGNTGRIFYVTKIDSSANALTVAGNGGDLINEASTFVLGYQDQAISLISTGSGWRIF